MQNPWKELSVKEWWLWSISMLIVTVSNLVGGSFDVLTLAATWVGITSLIFAAKGNVWAQFLMVAFSILYGIISFRFRYWGEMITYLGMTLPWRSGRQSPGCGIHPPGAKAKWRSESWRKSTSCSCWC